MAFRKRFIHPDLFSDWELIDLGLVGVLTFMGMICSADDVGNLKYCCKTIYAKTFPMANDVSVEDVETAVEGLVKVGLVKVYEVDGQNYLHINRFHKYQKPNHPSNPEHPIDKWSLEDEDLPKATREKILKWTNGVVSED
tara:strand:+ start:276 stop:695 length:420 start_codon:yes stop_codon:yes gene_type:complete